MAKAIILTKLMQGVKANNLDKVTIPDGIKEMQADASSNSIRG